MPEDLGRFALALALLAGICLAVLTLARVPVRRDAVVAIVRSGVQLSLVALIIAWVFAHPEAAGLYLAVMLGVAAVTSARRIRCGAEQIPSLALAIGLGAVCALVPILAVGALPFEAESILPFSAQVIGGSMTAASLTGSRLRDDIDAKRGEVEGWFALGASQRQASAHLARQAIAAALIPALDQTRSAGLVVLPGAFVGLLLGGASPAEAAQLQLLVLVGLLAAETVCAVLTAYLLAPVLAHDPRVAA